MKREPIDLDGPCPMRDWMLALIAGEHDEALLAANAADALIDPARLRLIRGDTSDITDADLALFLNEQQAQH